ncbi:MAG: hypothetical protein L6R39_001068 [Caloplaca ligustica]|nr:MAG: hypothetical protein L6R39_001068 [Caloplaca ligustica]
MRDSWKLLALASADRSPLQDSPFRLTSSDVLIAKLFIMPKSITISPSDDYHSLTLNNVPLPVPKPHELLLKVVAAALNHRDLYIRQGLYPSISFEAPLLADGCAIVLPHPNSAAGLKGFSAADRVIINPGTGWLSDPSGPEKAYTVLGGTSTTTLGTLQEMIAVPADDVELAPSHLSDPEAAALPLTGLTAWRAFSTKSGAAEAGRNILITGIGGGVALMVLLFAVAKGCTVFVTSSSIEKIARAKSVGARDGVVYTEEEWPTALRKKLPGDRPFLDAVIDGAGGDIVENTWRLLKFGGVYVSYGMTTMAPPGLPMQAVMKNIELRGSTMGSRREFTEMVRFVREKKIRPIVERTVHGIDDLEGIEGLFEDMKEGRQFGKLVVLLDTGGKGNQNNPKI